MRDINDVVLLIVSMRDKARDLKELNLVNNQNLPGIIQYNYSMGQENVCDEILSIIESWESEESVDNENAEQ